VAEPPTLTVRVGGFERGSVCTYINKDIPAYVLQRIF